MAFQAMTTMPRRAGKAIRCPVSLLLALAGGCYDSSYLDGQDPLIDFPADTPADDHAPDVPMDTIPDPSVDPGLDPDAAPDLHPDPDADPDPDPADAVDASDAEAEPPGGTVGDRCYSSTQCAGVPGTGRLCLTTLMGYLTFPGGYCSAACTSDVECGPEGKCMDVYDLGNFCLKMCDSAADCRTSEGYDCTAITGAPETPVCVPPSCCGEDAAWSFAPSFFAFPGRMLLSLP